MEQRMEQEKGERLAYLAVHGRLDNTEPYPFWRFFAPHVWEEMR